MQVRSQSISMFTLLLLASAIAAMAAAFPASAATTTGCVPAQNIEAIIDDSGSMLGTDPDANRVAAIKLLASKPGNAKKTLGALEFGSGDSWSTPPTPAAVTLFAPQTLGPNVASTDPLLTSNVKGDNAATDYNAAFALAKTDNPNANARIFITDGGHNADPYQNGHTPGPPTYVIGLDIGASSFDTEADQRLKQIAADTGGVYYPDVTKSTIQSVVNQIDAALNCQTVAKTFTDVFAKVGQVKKKSVSVPSNAKSIDLTMTWPSPLDTFTISKIKLKVKGGPTISIAKKRLRIKRSLGATFVNVHIRGVKRGKLSFQLKAKKFGSLGSATGVTLTTQAVPSRTK